MASEDAFNAAKMAFCSWGGFFKDVAQEIGAEKAIALYAKSGEAFEAWFAQTTRERLASPNGRGLGVRSTGSRASCDIWTVARWRAGGSGCGGGGCGGPGAADELTARTYLRPNTGRPLRRCAAG